MSDQPVVPQPAPATPVAEPASPDAAARAAQLEREVAELKSREGRFRNEKGVMQARIRELEQLALANGTGDPDVGQPSLTTPPAPSYPQYQPLQPPAQDVVSREEWDMDRFRREVPPQKFDAVFAIAQSAQVRQHLKYRPNAYGQAVPDVYATYKAIADSMELEELRKQQAASSPGRNPASGIISGNSAASTPELVDLNDPAMTPEKMKEMYPEAFAVPLAPTPWNR